MKYKFVDIRCTFVITDFTLTEIAAAQILRKLSNHTVDKGCYCLFSICKWKNLNYVYVYNDALGQPYINDYNPAKK